MLFLPRYNRKFALRALIQVFLSTLTILLKIIKRETTWPCKYETQRYSQQVDGREILLIRQPDMKDDDGCNKIYDHDRGCQTGLPSNYPQNTAYKLGVYRYMGCHQWNRYTSCFQEVSKFQHLIPAEHIILGASNQLHCKNNTNNQKAPGDIGSRSIWK